MVAKRIPAKAFAEQWEAAELAEDCRRLLNLDLPDGGVGGGGGHRRGGHPRPHHAKRRRRIWRQRRTSIGADLMRFVEKSVLLQTLDAVWKEHLLVLDQLRQGIYLRSYGQRDPLNEYKSEAFALFNAMLDDLKERVTVHGHQPATAGRSPPAAPATAGDDVGEPSGGGAGGAGLHHGVRPNRWR